MADTVCVSTPTRTSTVVSTSHSLATSFRTSVTTLPASTLTSLYTSCATSPNTTTCITSTSLIPQQAVVSTQIVTLTNTVDVPLTVLATLYGSSCRTVSNSSPYNPPSGSTTTDTTTETSQTTTTTTSTPLTTSTSYSTVTSTSLLTSDGTTYTSFYTSVSTALSVPSNQSNPPAQGKGNNNTAAIVGGTLGGIAALGLLALLTWRMIKKSHRFDNLFKEESNYLGPPKKPPTNSYQYGLVGQQDTSQSMAFSPPHSPGIQQSHLVNEIGYLNNTVGNEQGTLQTNASSLGFGSTGNETGMQSGFNGNDMGYNAPNQTPIHHLRNPSAAPLLVGMAGAAVGAAVSGHTRPNTGSSGTSDFVGPLMTHTVPSQNMGYPPQQVNSYPSALNSYAQQQGIVHSQVQPQQPNISHNPSVTTVASNSGLNPSAFVPVGSATRRSTNSNISQQQQQQQQQRLSQRYEDTYSRTSSSVGYQQDQYSQGVLQVRNADPGMFAEGSSSVAGTPGLSVTSAPLHSDLDGKGRPLNFGGEKAPLVHLDGGAYADTPRTPAPPAYRE